MPSEYDLERDRRKMVKAAEDASRYYKELNDARRLKESMDETARAAESMNKLINSPGVQKVAKGASDVAAAVTVAGTAVNLVGSLVDAGVKHFLGGKCDVCKGKLDPVVQPGTTTPDNLFWNCTECGSETPYVVGDVHERKYRDSGTFRLIPTNKQIAAKRNRRLILIAALTVLFGLPAISALTSTFQASHPVAPAVDQSTPATNTSVSDSGSGVLPASNNATEAAIVDGGNSSPNNLSQATTADPQMSDGAIPARASASETASATAANNGADAAYFGAHIVPLNESFIQQLHLPENIKGVLVDSVALDSPAKAAGIAPGQLIVSIDGTAVTEPGQVVQILSRHQPGDTLQCVVSNGKEEALIPVNLSVPPPPTE